MSTSIKVRDDDKHRLDLLQARLGHDTHKRWTQQELMRYLIDLGERHFEELVGPRGGDDVWDELLALPMDSRLPPMDHDDMDRHIYGA